MFSFKGVTKALSIILSSGITYDSAASLVLSITFLAVPGLIGLYFSRQAKKFWQENPRKEKV